ncbi:MAG: FHIPEP family type III secretion protein, partial [Candidatus Binatia bacterium]
MERVGQAIPLSLEVGSELYEVFRRDARWTHCLGVLYPKLQMHLTRQLGVLFPELKLSLNPQWRRQGRYQIRIYDVPVDDGALNPTHCAVMGRRKWWPPAGVEAPQAGETAHGTPVQWVGLRHQRVLVEQGITAFGPEEMLLRHIAKVLKRHAADFIGIQEVHNLLAVVERDYPELVREVVPKLISVQKLTEVVKRLVEEEVPIKDFRLILQILSDCQPEEKDPISLTELVRIGLRRTLTARHAAEGSRVHAFTIAPRIEEDIRRGIRRNGNECFLVLPPDHLQRLVQTFRSRLGPAAGRHAVLLTQSDIRRYVRKVIENELPHRPVLSYQELDPRAVIHHLGMVDDAADGETVVVLH